MLTLQFLPYSQIAGLDSDKKIKRILRLVKDENIVLMEGNLSKDEETELIKRTMEEIKGRFRGIEISTIDSEDKNTNDFFNNAKKFIYNFLVGNRSGFTIIGPASIIKEIKKDPNKIQLLTLDKRRRK